MKDITIRSVTSALVQEKHGEAAELVKFRRSKVCKRFHLNKKAIVNLQRSISNFIVTCLFASILCQSLFVSCPKNNANSKKLILSASKLCSNLSSSVKCFPNTQFP